MAWWGRKDAGAARHGRGRPRTSRSEITRARRGVCRTIAAERSFSGSTRWPTRPAERSRAAGSATSAPEFEKKNAAILGVSFDAVETNASSRGSRDSRFRCSRDTDRAIGLAYGACDVADGPVRRPHHLRHRAGRADPPGASAGLARIPPGGAARVPLTRGPGAVRSAARRSRRRRGRSRRTSGRELERAGSAQLARPTTPLGRRGHLGERLRERGRRPDDATLAAVGHEVAHAGQVERRRSGPRRPSPRGSRAVPGRRRRPGRGRRPTTR